MGDGHRFGFHHQNTRIATLKSSKTISFYSLNKERKTFNGQRVFGSTIFLYGFFSIAVKLPGYLVGFSPVTVSTEHSKRLGQCQCFTS